MGRYIGANTYIHTHIYIYVQYIRAYIYIYLYICVCVCAVYTPVFIALHFIAFHYITVHNYITQSNKYKIQQTNADTQAHAHCVYIRCLQPISVMYM